MYDLNSADQWLWRFQLHLKAASYQHWLELQASFISDVFFCLFVFW